MKKIITQFHIVKYLNDDDLFRYLLYEVRKDGKTLLGDFNYRKLILKLAEFLD